MEQKVQQLIQRLAQIGYQPFEINQIMNASGGNKTAQLKQLKRYEHLGKQYLHHYSQ